MASKDLRYFLELSYPVELVREDDGRFFARNPDLPGCVAEGNTADEVIENLSDSRALWIESRLEDGYDVPEPDISVHSGKLSLRMSPSLHASLSEMAKGQDISLNLLINTILAERVGAVAGEKSKSREDFRALVQVMVETIRDNALSSSAAGVLGSARPQAGASSARGAGGELVQLDEYRKPLSA
jgi:predicted RNase H-like HicB family nuclease